MFDLALEELLTWAMKPGVTTSHLKMECDSSLT